MTKKIFVTLILFIFFTACGKKSDPVYTSEILNVQNTPHKKVL